MIKKGKVTTSTKKIVTGTHADPGHEDETFRPVVTSRSSNLKPSDVNVYSRLYTQATHHTEKRKSLIAEAMAEYIHNIDVKDADTIFPKGWEEAPSPEYVNEIEYSHKYAFVVKHLASGGSGDSKPSSPSSLK